MNGSQCGWKQDYKTSSARCKFFSNSTFSKNRKNNHERVFHQRDCPRSFEMEFLDSGGVKHDADALADGLGGQVLSELGSNGTAATVGSSHFAPDHPQLVGFVVRARDTGGFLRLVNVSALLAQVEVAMASSGNALETKQRRVLMLSSQTALVAGEDGFDI